LEDVRRRAGGIGFIVHPEYAIVNSDNLVAYRNEGSMEASDDVNLGDRSILQNRAKDLGHLSSVVATYPKVADVDSRCNLSPAISKALILEGIDAHITEYANVSQFVSYPKRKD